MDLRLGKCGIVVWIFFADYVRPPPAYGLLQKVSGEERITEEGY